MIVKDKVSWVRLLFHFRGSSFMETWPRILTVTVTASVVTYIELYYSIQAYTLTTTPFLLVGVALGIFLGFATVLHTINSGKGVSYGGHW